MMEISKVAKQMLNIKLVIPSIVGSIAILGMSSAYADEASILETITSKENVSLESKAKTDIAIKDKKTSMQESLEIDKSTKKNKTTANSNDALADQESNEALGLLDSDDDDNDKTDSDLKKKAKPKLHNKDNKQRKTHYGIGYEYRKGLRERENQSVKRVERPEKIQRPDRIDRPVRIERPGRPERHNR